MPSPIRPVFLGRAVYHGCSIVGGDAAQIVATLQLLICRFVGVFFWWLKKTGKLPKL
jgi:hypothetical protein